MTTKVHPHTEDSTNASITQDSQWWLNRLHRDYIKIQCVARRDGGRVLLLSFVDNGLQKHIGELHINPDGTWSAETL